MWNFLIIFIACVMLDNCESGFEIRLTNSIGVSSGNSLTYGYVEVFNSGIWNPICGNNWQQTGSQVLCRMLGYSTSSHYLYTPYIASIYNISCTGSERSLEECVGSIGYQSFIYSGLTLAYVRCGSGNKTSTNSNPTGLGVRLVGASNPYEGRVELFVLNQWINIYAPNNTWSDREAAVVCRSLGFSAIGSKSFKTYFLNNVICSGQEKSLDQCVYNTADCVQGSVVYLQCGCYSSGCSGSGNYCDIIRGTCVTACSPGSYYNGYCQSCPVGMYQPLQHQYSCSQCPAGTYQDRTGQTLCIACPSGSYQAKAGQASCDKCLPGTYQNQIGQSSCNPCPAGTYQYWPGQTSCIACDLGTYQNSSGQIVCVKCGNDKTTDRAGLDSSSDCHDEQLAVQDGLNGQPQTNLVIIGGVLMIGIVVVNIIVCIVILKRFCQKTGQPTTRTSLPVRRRNVYVSETPVRDEAASSANNPARHTDSEEEHYEAP